MTLVRAFARARGDVCLLKPEPAVTISVFKPCLGLAAFACLLATSADAKFARLPATSDGSVSRLRAAVPPSQLVTHPPLAKGAAQP